MKRFLKNDVSWGKRALMLLICDIMAINLASVLALAVRFDFNINSIPNEYWSGYYNHVVVDTLMGIIIFYFHYMYNSLWVFASINEAWNVLCGSLATVIFILLQHIVTGDGMPRSYYPLTFVFLTIMVGGVRFSYRILRFVKYEKFQKDKKGYKNVLIVGAGAAGKLVADEIHVSTELKYNLKGFVDDMPSKRGRLVSSVTVIGTLKDIDDLVEKYGIDIIFVAIPSLDNKRRSEILSICQETGCEVRTLPGVYQLVDGAVKLNQMRKVCIEDLLGREQIKINDSDINGYLEGKTILVTGGGGSIGSELCRQIAARNPKRLIIFDIYENNAYDIQQELVKAYPKLKLTVLIGSVRNTNRINTVFAKYKPDIVYHAAAHKHVPLMENSPNEAIKNNVFGTYKTAMAAAKYGTKRFVLISTDKAVNPTNIMGASKRLCEMIVQMMSRKYSTEFVAVRFGNVLGSNGSVVPLFRKQIEAGGPVTVTHKDIIRYFMTIPEAVMLVLQAGAYANGGEIFVLDMGDPVKIDDLARNMIRLSGYTPDVDIKIEYVGLRPGEKLYEEMLMEEEGLEKTDNNRIYIGKPIDMDDKRFYDELMQLKVTCEKDDEAIKLAVSQMVGTYKVDKAS